MNNRRSRSSPDDQAKQGEIRFRCPCAAQRRGRWDAARTGACEMAEIEWNSSLDRSRGLGNYAAASGRHRFVCQQRRLCSGSVFFLPFLVFFSFFCFFFVGFAAGFLFRVDCVPTSAPADGRMWGAGRVPPLKTRIFWLPSYRNFDAAIFHQWSDRLAVCPRLIAGPGLFVLLCTGADRRKVQFPID